MKLDSITFEGVNKPKRTSDQDHCWKKNLYFLNLNIENYYM